MSLIEIVALLGDSPTKGILNTPSDQARCGLDNEPIYLLDTNIFTPNSSDIRREVRQLHLACIKKSTTLTEYYKYLNRFKEDISNRLELATALRDFLYKNNNVYITRKVFRELFGYRKAIITTLREVKSIEPELRDFYPNVCLSKGVVEIKNSIEGLIKYFKKKERILNPNNQRLNELLTNRTRYGYEEKHKPVSKVDINFILNGFLLSSAYPKRVILLSHDSGMWGILEWCKEDRPSGLIKKILGKDIKIRKREKVDVLPLGVFDTLYDLIPPPPISKIELILALNGTENYFQKNVSSG